MLPPFELMLCKSAKSKLSLISISILGSLFSSSTLNSFTDNWINFSL